MPGPLAADVAETSIVVLSDGLCHIASDVLKFFSVGGPGNQLRRHETGLHLAGPHQSIEVLVHLAQEPSQLLVVLPGVSWQLDRLHIEEVLYHKFVSRAFFSSPSARPFSLECLLQPVSVFGVHLLKTLHLHDLLKFVVLKLLVSFVVVYHFKMSLSVS